MPTGPLVSPLRRSGAVARGVLLTALVLVLCSAGLPASSALHPRSVPLVPELAGPCLGAGAPATARGTVVLVGTSTPLPSLAGVPVQVDYFYAEITTTGNQTSQSCVPTTATGTTGAGGTLSVPLSIPTSRCLPPVCVVYSGPYGPLGFTTFGAPAGFFERDPTNGTSPGTIAWEAYLDRAQVNLAGGTVVSQNAPVHLSASAWDARGNPAPAPLTFVWSLAGHGWKNLSQSGPNITVEGIYATWTGSLSVTVTATFGATAESAQSAVVNLQPVSTSVRSATASPAPVDPGVPVTFYVTGFGAAGYIYSATVDPGLGAGAAIGPCLRTDLPNGTTNLTCQVEAAYPVAGTALPTASISNGYSTGQLAVAPVSVHPVEQVQLGGLSLVTYPGRALELTLNVTGGTGSAPYGPACLSPGFGAGVTCQFQNGTSWRFNESFPTPGRYAVLASVTDRFHENVSAAAAVLVVPFLSARVNGNSSVALVTNESRLLSVVVVGGAFPIAMWWNLSPSSTLLFSENLGSDGTISFLSQASLPGLLNVTVTLRDALGSEASLVFRITVSASPSGSATPGGPVFPHLSAVAVGGLAGAILGGTFLAAWVVRRRLQVRGRGADQRVEEDDLERMARGRDHLLGRADPVVARPPDELASGWTGPPVAPEEWAEWIAALTADGSLIPTRGPDRRLLYRRAPPRPSPVTIHFDPTVWEAKRAPVDDPPDAPGTPGGRQGGG
ncbi:MAG: hypothetical protein L3K14_01805 [Thermoplasmata archaeon]|nr:hypothetical protein [Thermoplasmata archaeon]